jgi:hypothetical protein
VGVSGGEVPVFTVGPVVGSSSVGPVPGRPVVGPVPGGPVVGIISLFVSIGYSVGVLGVYSVPMVFIVGTTVVPVGCSSEGYVHDTVVVTLGGGSDGVGVVTDGDGFGVVTDGVTDGFGVVTDGVTDGFGVVTDGDGVYDVVLTA